MADTKVILLVEDDLSIRDVLALHIREEGFGFEWAGDGELGLRMALEKDYALVLLDVNLPKVSGIEVCRTLRRKKETLPIIMITSRGNEIDKVVGLEVGADDYVVKPFGIFEMMARIRTRLRLQSHIAPATESSGLEVIDIGSLVIDPEFRTVSLNGNPVELTRKEFDLLLFLASRPGKPVSRDQILEKVWGFGSQGYEESVNTLVLRLRRKLSPKKGDPDYIRAVRGIGYRFATSADLTAGGVADNDTDDEN